MADRTRKYDSTVARIAGNILSGQKWPERLTDETITHVAREAVRLARGIVAEVERTTIDENANVNGVGPSLDTERHRER